MGFDDVERVSAMLRRDFGEGKSEVSKAQDLKWRSRRRTHHTNE
jgi:hypothetical protein